MSDTIDLARLDKLLAEMEEFHGGPLFLRVEPYPLSEADAPAWPYEAVTVDECGDREAAFIDKLHAELASAAVNALPHLLSRISELESALRAFAEALGEDDADEPDHTSATLVCGRTRDYSLDLGDFRQARNVLGEKV